MSSDRLTKWLDALGYSEASASLHQASDTVPSDHPYALELIDLLRPDGAIRAKAVFDVEGMPTVAFVDDEGRASSAQARLDALRQRIWNQNLISIVLVLDDDQIHPYPTQRGASAAAPLPLGQASSNGPFSMADVASNEIQHRLPTWFSPEARVDGRLLRNLSVAVQELIEMRIRKRRAQFLVGQILFISYLEHREIVSAMYRSKRRVSSLHELVAAHDAAGIARLVDRLRQDFNGDFLAADDDLGDIWQNLPKRGFAVLDDFLRYVDLDTGQQDFWNYDFSFLPVELLSGIYESFLGDEQDELAAYYTPRHLANLVIDRAFAGSQDVLKEVIYDGACGSGILLTTAFRRVLGVAERRKGVQLTLRERIELLTTRIFGSDISDAARRVTAFSLYLSLLERLEPSDILALQENEGVKLPRLRGKTLFGGETDGDFFADTNPLAGRQRFSLVLSNPPWKEPSGSEETSADAWAQAQGVPRARRQLAGDFAHRVIDSLTDDGRLCLIMPTSLFLAPTSRGWLQGWLLRARPLELINFGDLQAMIFATASHSCTVVVAAPPRDGAANVPAAIPIDETFEYWSPKADMGLAFGRLTLHSADRHRVQTQAAFDDPGRLVTLMWGGDADLTLWRRLRLLGSFGDVIGGAGARWQRRKGVHLVDNSVQQMSAAPLRKIPHVPVGALKAGGPVVHPSYLLEFPRDIKTVARIGYDLEAVFRGPRILFPDGFSKEREIRAAYLDSPASFTSSIGVIAGPEEDAELLQFAAVYLRSDLVRYFLVMRAYQVLCERNRVSMRDVEEYPFVVPDQHPEPRKARTIVAQVSAMARKLAKGNEFEQTSLYQKVRPAMDELVFDYFGLTERERELVRETVRELLPSVRPRGYRSLFTPMQHRADLGLLAGYAKRLQAELEAWRERLGGRGEFAVEVLSSQIQGAGPLGAVRLSIAGKVKASVAVGKQGPRNVSLLLKQLREAELLPMPLSTDWSYAADALIWLRDEVYLIRPLVRRCWLQRCAIRDARRLVDELLRHQSHPPTPPERTQRTPEAA